MTEPTAKVSTLIRRPPKDVFDAFTSADTIRKFWLSRTSGPLAPGAVVQWEFMVPGAKDTVTVTGFDSGRRLAFSFSNGNTVEMKFEPHGNDVTRVTIALGGFTGKDVLDDVTNNVEGFTIVLCDLKTLLELGSSAHLVKDKAELIASTKK